ncbi:MAG: hypothetical protein KGI41_00705 [Patescibacteria group bacterium]|nr:hypothetical protein [Patescibacteria group bacterium]MDE1965749.1 hypothetical protein [Patescibacteria group bacterium]
MDPRLSAFAKKVLLPLILFAAMLALASYYFLSPVIVVKTPAGALSGTSSAAVLPAALAALTNADRAASGLGVLAESALLTKAAQMKADDMAARGYFSHTTPEGKSPLSFLDAVGYRYQNVGENLGLNYASSAAVEEGWMNSPEHRANILLPQFTEIGVGYATGTYEGYPATFTVELLATPLPPLPLAPSSVPVAAAHPSSALLTSASAETQATSATTSVLAAQMTDPFAGIRALIDSLTVQLRTLSAEVSRLKAN